MEPEPVRTFKTPAKMGAAFPPLQAALCTDWRHFKRMRPSSTLTRQPNRLGRRKSVGCRNPRVLAPGAISLALAARIAPAWSPFLLGTSYIDSKRPPLKFLIVKLFNRFVGLICRGKF